jgi:hypothetical protein
MDTWLFYPGGGRAAPEDRGLTPEEFRRRIISARPAKRKERDEYRKAYPD